MGRIKYFIQEFIFEGLIIHLSFTLGQKNWPYQKKAIVFVNGWKVANYTECKTKFIVQHLAHL